MMELVASSTLEEAQAAIHAGGDGVRDGVAILLVGMQYYREKELVGGANGGQVGVHWSTVKGEHEQLDPHLETLCLARMSCV